MLTTCSASEFGAITSEVAAVAPLPKSYRLRFKLHKPDRGCDAHGWCERAQRRPSFTITIVTGLTAAHTADVVIHEVAHVLDWSAALRPLGQDHSPTFWYHFGVVWCAYYQAR